MKKINNFYALITVILVILGFIFSSQATRQYEIQKSKTASMRELNDLVIVLKQKKGKQADLEKKLVNLKSQIDDIDSQKIDESNPLYDKMHKLAGLTKVKGDGLIIKLQDRPVSKNTKMEENGLIVNDGCVQSEDLLKLVNELKATGAEAISINNQRLVTTSEIVTAGNNIMINQTRIFPPYEVKAIGNTGLMTSTLKMHGGIIEYLRVFGILIDIKRDKITIPAYKGRA